MKSFKLTLGVTRTVRAVSLTLLAAGLFAGYAAAAGIANTKHDLSSGSTGPNKFSGTGELCVFCHTPHGADSTAAVPLWNRTLPVPTSFTSYNMLGTTSLTGAQAPVGSVSIACLSCHDGTVAMNTLINAPGSGLAGDATWTAGTWNAGTLTLGKIAGTATNIGTDLKNDHPIGIQYGGGPLTTIPAAGTSYSSFRNPDFFAASSTTINGAPVWWVDVAGGTTAREKSDMLLYTRTLAIASGGTGSPEPFVECATCHDPHNSTNGLFLRSANTGSKVCLACHNK